MKLFWIVPALLLLTACASAEATATVPSNINLNTNKPSIAQAKQDLAQEPPDTKGNEYGYVDGVSSNGTWYARIITRHDIGVLSQDASYGCKDYVDDNELRQLTQPGDIIEWPGGNWEVCVNNLKILSPVK